MSLNRAMRGRVLRPDEYSPIQQAVNYLLHLEFSRLATDASMSDSGRTPWMPLNASKEFAQQ
jgi:hypothetical protein